MASVILIISFFILLEIFLRLLGKKIDREKLDGILFRYRGAIPVPLLVILIFFLIFGFRSQRQFRFRGWILNILGILIAIVGEAFRMWAVGYLGRKSRSQQVQAKGLVTAGPYSFVRNPLYFGNLLICLGLSLITGSLIAVISCLAYFMIFYRRIISSEERYLFLQFKDEYIEYCRRVRRLIPRFTLPAFTRKGTFNWRGLSKEYNTIVAIITMFILLETLNFLPIDKPMPLKKGVNEPKLLATYTISLSPSAKEILDLGNETKLSGKKNFVSKLKEHSFDAIVGATAFSFATIPADIDDLDEEEQVWPIGASLIFAWATVSNINEARNGEAALGFNAKGIGDFIINPYLDGNDWTIGFSASKKF